MGLFGIKEVALSLLKSIRSDKSPGPDGIYPTLLRVAREEIVGALTKIFVRQCGLKGLFLFCSVLCSMILRGSRIMGKISGKIYLNEIQSWDCLFSFVMEDNIFP